MTRRGRLLTALAGVGGMMLVLFGATEVTRRAIDPAVVQARLIAEVQHRTGRALAFDNLTLRVLPDLRVDADNVALANPAGFSRPAMLTAAHLTARIALLPLLRHRVVITDLALHGTDLELERPADGPPNWVFATGRPSAALSHAAQAISLPRWRLDRLTLLGLTYDGTIGWRGIAGGGMLPIERLTLREVNDSSTIALDLAGSLGGDAVRLSGQFGGQSHLWHTGDTTPWPVDLHLAASEGTIGVTGSLTGPDTLSGYDLAITADGPDVGRLFTAWPALHVPRLADVHLATRVVDRADGIDVPRLSLTAGASDLSDLVDGLAIDRLAIAAPNIDGGNGGERNRIDAGGHYAGQQATITASLGPVGRLFGRGAAWGSPIALDAALDVAGASVGLHGRVAPGGDWSGTDVTLDARIPDLSLLSPLAGRPLPQWQGIAAHGAAVARRGQLTLSDVVLDTPVVKLTAAGNAWLGGRPRVVGTIQASLLDLDAIGAAWRAAARRPPGARPAVAEVSTPTDGTGDGWIIPDRPMPLLTPLGFDADLTLGIDAARLHGVDLHRVSAHAVLAAGHLAIDPFSAELGTAAIGGRAGFDGSAHPGGYALKLTAPGLDARAALALVGLPPVADGMLDLDADLTATGNTPHAWAGTLNGYAGAVLIGGVDNAALAAAVNRISPAAKLGLALPAQGQTSVTCLATRLDIRDGVAVPAVFLLDTRRFRLAASGAVDLGQERFALRLRPYVVLGGTGLILPSRADGPWQTPRLTLEGRSDGGAGSLATGMAAPGSALGMELGDLASAADASLRLADTGDCGQAIAAARDTSGTAPDISPPPAAAAKPARHSALDLLKRLFKFGRKATP